MSIFSSGQFWVAVDWAAESYSAFLMKKESLVDSKTGEPGVLQVKDGAFEAALKTIVDPWLSAHGEFPIILSGLVGAREGWVEVAYVRTPCSNRSILDGVVKVPVNQLKNVSIVPGILHSGDEYSEVLNGEEVSIIGAIKDQGISNGWLLKSGAHCKLVRVEDDAITQLSTYITGELYSVLDQHSSLCRHAGVEQKVSSIDFMTGVRTALQSSCLSKILFSVSTRRLVNQIEAEHVSSYLSGLLIGHEFRDFKSMGLDDLVLISSGQLMELYQLAFDELSIQTVLVDSQRTYLLGAQFILESLEDVS
ncbi:2-dehydro-3-deoxygalactonokinase [Endozoicomonas sp. SCSIO W0465]|uniref:2-dehydro-3-deoxygalactonokinase n=1 Tax=Endozoicomonas sp. SCSIO W0465 TaxID=2918516 RepID=UPI0020758D44|nr:2-dehydro-3-deoxygalactonokinase [Endozoicomonas sp. SCSIO W0465]USE34031.1 2-dehydro-3-deoxygalactonokinase [Endozoicomonas sp. SCSIO W0465]